jgi:cell division protein FtsQ
MSKMFKKTSRLRHSHSRFPRIIAWLLFLSIFTVFSVIGGQKMWIWMQKPSSFPIKQFHIEGQLTHETPQTVQKIIQSGISGGFFSLNVSQAKAQLLGMPWVSHVSFRRVWPATLNIRVDEHQPLARFGKNGVLTTEGHVFYPEVNTIPTDLPELMGPENQAQNLLNFYQTLSSLAKPLGLTIVALTVNAEQSWDLKLSNQIQVILGRVDALKRFQQFVFIYPKIVASSKQTIMLIDLRYPNGAAVQYQ